MYQVTNRETLLHIFVNCRSRDGPPSQSYPDKNSAFPEGSVSRMTGICTPAKSQKHSKIRQCSRPFRSFTANGLMNIGRLENIGPAPDSGPMRHIRIKDPQRRLYYGSSARKSHGFKQKTKTKYVKAEAYHRFFSKNAVSAEYGPLTLIFLLDKYFIVGFIIFSSSLNLSTLSQ